MTLTEDIKRIRKTDIKKKVDRRLKSFRNLNKKPSKYWFSELCFCILTANSKARTAMAIQKELGNEGFYNRMRSDLTRCIKENKHRFHNNKARFIVQARKHKNINEKIKKIIYDNGQKAAREWLVKNIKGLGYKEASHFLRNVGYTDLAIIDRHILNLLYEYKYIKKRPESLTKKIYLNIEEIFNTIAKRMEISCAELDLYMWYMKTGEVLK